MQLTADVYVVDEMEPQYYSVIKVTQIFSILYNSTDDYLLQKYYKMADFSQTLLSQSEMLLSMTVQNNVLLLFMT